MCIEYMQSLLEEEFLEETSYGNLATGTRIKGVANEALKGIIEIRYLLADQYGKNKNNEELYNSLKNKIDKIVKRIEVY